ncbi:Hypothetical protein CINCED_3A022339, partial [Cinara cedri]
MSSARQNKNKGCGLVNTSINKLPIELHLPGYQYCGPGTDLKKYIARDYILENRAWERFKLKDANFKKKSSAWTITTPMKTKLTLGAGCGFKTAVKATKSYYLHNVHRKKQFNFAVKLIDQLARNEHGINNLDELARSHDITYEKSGVLTIFSGLSALGAITGGIANVVKVINDFKVDGNIPVHSGKEMYLTPYKSVSYKIEK